MRYPINPSALLALEELMKEMIGVMKMALFLPICPSDDQRVASLEPLITPHKVYLETYMPSHKYRKHSQIPKTWRHYLYGTKSAIYTDHKSLQHIFDQKELNMSQRRWIELFSDYECEIRYHPGKANVVANALSMKERLKPRRVRAMAVTIQAGMREKIQAAQSEALSVCVCEAFVGFFWEAKHQEAEVPQDLGEHEESVPTPSNDPQPSGEDRMQLTDLMVLCTKLQTQVLALQTAKDAQAKEIASLKKRIQRLERKKMSRPTCLKKLKKIGMIRRVESSEDQESLGAPKDASKQGRILEDDEMHVEAKVDRKDEQSTKPDDSTAGEAVTTASVDDSVVPTTIEEITLAQTLIHIKAAKPKVVTTAATTTTTTRPTDKGVVVQEPSKFRVPQETQPSSSKDKGKGIMIEPEVSLKRKDQTRDIQAKLDVELLEEQKLARKQEEEANIALIESWENTQAMMEADSFLAERLQ
ncbi:ribonuclease H-like domain-containing protein [Tanacetum coccineum]